ncbi:DUF3344 domain-containing protein [Methanogenium sp. S4BF]|uniref:DUF3344 domain-containing protein n=1 Tax=Methanogenium sp. S4BF TaxID=1789226 RepID=UPI002417AD77|nr:DUF3344 domain-containing protein [Methanogenium sp. S4BF]WFN34320.1 DUF3344 domain-containing protein [Methanogenium sp. S4BF]
MKTERTIIHDKSPGLFLFLGLILMLAIVPVGASAADVDLNVTDVAPNSGAGNDLFAQEPNTLTATVINKGLTDAGAFTVTIDVAGTPYTADVAGLAANTSTTVTVTDTVLHTGGDTITITVTADTDNVVEENDETNNNLTVTATVYNNGYKGKRWTDGADIENIASFTGQYDLTWSAGNTAYNGASWTEQTYSWSPQDLPIPEGATVVNARLCQGWTYNKMGTDPAFTMSFNGNIVYPEAAYQDVKGFGSYSNPYGLYAYNVTDLFDAAGNSMTITPEADNTYGLYGAYLLVVYEDPETSTKAIWINEEFDMLYSYASYSVSDTEATAYAPFTGVDTTNIADATAIAILASGADANKSVFIFNNQEYEGFWADYQRDPQIGFSLYDVTTALTDGDNEAAMRSLAIEGKGDNMYAMGTILVVEYADVDLNVTDVTPNSGAGNDLFAQEPNTLTATVINKGLTDAGAFTVTIDVAGTPYTADVAGLAANTSTTVTVTDTVLHTGGDTITITVNADTDNVVEENDETNNNLTVTATVYNNGYKGKRWTDGADIENIASFTGQYDLTWSAGNTAYNGASWTEQTYSWSPQDLPIPEGATVVNARLCQGWTYNKMGTDPAFTMSFNGNIVYPEAAYQDVKGFGSYSNPYGLYAYNVTDLFDAAGNSMTITPEADNTYGLYGAYLLVVYEDPETSTKAIWINEEFDMLYSYASYSVSDTEATAYAPFTGVDTTNIADATAIAILASGADANKSVFIFNNQEYEGFWADYQRDPQIGFSLYDVTTALTDGDNEAAMRSLAIEGKGDNMYAMGTILVVEYRDVIIADFTATPMCGIPPLTVQFTDQSLGATSWAWDFDNDGTIDETTQNPSHVYATSGTYTVNLTINGGEAFTTKQDCIRITSLLLGDANSDGGVNQADTLRVLKEVVGITPSPAKNTDAFERTDVNWNNAIDIGDAMYIAQYNVGLRDRWFALV